MTFTYWSQEMTMPELGTAESLWRHSDNTAWEYRSLVDGQWHQPRGVNGPGAPDPSRMRELSPPAAQQMFENAPSEMYVYVQSLLGDSGRRGAVSRRIPSPESYQDQMFTVDGTGGKWKPTNTIAEFTNTFAADRPNLVPVSYEDAREHVAKKGDSALREFDRPFSASTATSQLRASVARTGKFNPMAPLPESPGEMRTQKPPPKLAEVHPRTSGVK